MDKLKMQSMNLTNENVKKIGKLFPNCIVESMKDGELVHSIDFDMLRQELSTEIVEGPTERYQFTWPDKRQAILSANAPINKTLRPCREESVDFDNTENLYIEGDNLDVLKLLQETYLEKVDVIYIDPPYNTGSSLIYKNNYYKTTDDFSNDNGDYDEEGNVLFQNTKSNGRFHTDWLNMLYPRLKVSKNLLKNSGIIVLTIDDYEINSVITIMNEIFGEDNRLGTVVIKNNPSGRSTVKGFSINHEYALFYQKSDTAELGRMEHNDAQKARYREYDENGFFEWENFRKNGTDSDRSDRPKQYYPLIYNIKTESIRLPSLTWNENKKEYDFDSSINNEEVLLFPNTPAGQEKVWKFGIERTKQVAKELQVRKVNNKYEIYRKKYLNTEGVLPHTWWDKPEYSARDNGTRELVKIFGPQKLFDFPKAPEAVKDALIFANLPKDGVVLDFFSGSATTAQAVMTQNFQDVFDGKPGKRKFIMVQLPESTDEKSEAYKAGYKNICEIGKERIRRAGKIEYDNAWCTAGSSLRWNDEKKKELGDKYVCPDDVDIGFRVLKLDSSNMKDVYYNPSELNFNTLDDMVDNIKEDRTPEDLLFQVMLDLGVLPSSKIVETEIAGKKVFDVADNFLIACFDKEITDDVITEIAKKKPYYFVMRDSSMASDSVATNFEQIFATYSPDTVRKVL